MVFLRLLLLRPLCTEISKSSEWFSWAEIQPTEPETAPSTMLNTPPSQPQSPPHPPQLHSYTAKGQTSKAYTEKCWCRSKPEPISCTTSLHPSFQQPFLIFSFAQLKTDSLGYGDLFNSGNAVNILSSPVTASLSHKVLKNLKRLELTMTKKKHRNWKEVGIFKFTIDPSQNPP